jgi:bacterioferritin
VFRDASVTIPGLGTPGASAFVTIPASPVEWGPTIPTNSRDRDRAIAFVANLLGPVGRASVGRERPSVNRAGSGERSRPGASSIATPIADDDQIDLPPGVSTPLAAWWVEHDRLYRRATMATAAADKTTITREILIQKLNEDLAREYQAIIAYTVYSQVLKGAEYMAIAEELKVHAGEELEHAITIAKQIDYLGGMPTTKALPVKETDDAREMLRADLENENATIRAYRERVAQCEALQEYAIAEDIREILRQEQEHQIDLATALGEEVPNLAEARRV